MTRTTRAKKPALLNYTTSIKAAKTVAEIQQVLMERGAQFINIEYGEPFRSSGRVPVALTFSMNLGEQTVAYRLPVRWEGTRRALRKLPPRFHSDSHAFNVAWRIIKDWVEAQVALIQSEQAEMGEVFLPYAILSNGNTAWEQFKAQRALPAPGREQ